MPKVVWSADNDRKLLIRLIDRSAKSYDSVSLALLFPGATPKAIEERIAKLKREAKALDGPGKFSRVPSVPSIASPRKKRMGTKLEMEVADDVEDHMTKKRVKRECHLDDKDADYNPRFDK